MGRVRQTLGKEPDFDVEVFHDRKPGQSTDVHRAKLIVNGRPVSVGEGPTKARACEAACEEWEISEGRWMRNS